MFICFEGVDGAGKSTQARMLVQRLQADGVAAELVADPGTTSIGTAIRQILLHNDAPIQPAAQMLLFSAARAELAAYIRQRLAAGVVVVCDRWILSTLVYQGVLNGISQDTILDIFKRTCDLWPDVCFVLDLSPESAVSRMGQPRDRYERRSAAEREHMRAEYLKLSAGPYAQVTHILDAAGNVADTHNAIFAVISTARAP
jgi:dTMP kinase